MSKKSKHDSITSEDLEGLETVDDVYTMEEIIQQQESYLKEIKEKLGKAKKELMETLEKLITKTENNLDNDPEKNFTKIDEKTLKLMEIRHDKATDALEDAKKEIEEQRQQMELLDKFKKAREPK